MVIPGTAQDTTIDGGGVQDIETGGLAIGSVLNGGSEYVEGGGTAYSTTISAGKLEVDSGGSVDGGVYFATGGSGTLLLDNWQTFYQIPFRSRDLRMVTGWTSPILPSERRRRCFRKRPPTTPPAH